MDARAKAIIEALGGTKQIRQDFHATDICAFGAGIALRFKAKDCLLGKVNSVYFVDRENGSIDVEFNILKGNRVVQNAAWTFNVKKIDQLKSISIRTMKPNVQLAQNPLPKADTHPSLFA